MVSDPDLTGRTLGEFVLRAKIGTGSYGAVYCCEQPMLHRNVVVKVLHAQRQQDHVSRARFFREAYLASQLDHPYAPHVYNFGVDATDGLWWIAMELVQGVTLGKWLETHGPMPLERFVPYFDCITDAVQAAHGKGIIHRDLKPSNMMVTERNGRLIAMLLDWGIAKVEHDLALQMPASWTEGPLGENHAATDTRKIDSAPLTSRTRLTGSGACLGSLAYMSPEQWIDAEAVGPGADIYSLGVVAYQALTGRAPFCATNADDYYHLHRDAPIPSLGPSFSRELDRVVRTALSKYPDLRHASVAEFASELRAALRASDKEQIRVSAQQWEDQDRAAGLLWGADMLANVAECVPTETLSKSECAFLAESHRRVRGVRWIRKALVAFFVLSAVAIAAMKIWMAQEQARMQLRLAQEQTHVAQQVADATIMQAELEQGNSRLLHGEPEALSHLAEAYKRSPLPSIAFMFARALQPRLAEQARFSSTMGRMWTATFSPNNERIVTTDDQDAQVRDAKTGRLLSTLRHGDIVYDAVYAPNGEQLATAGGDGTVKVWDSDSGMLVRELRFDGAKLRYYIAIWSPDSKLVVAIDLKGEKTCVWSAETGALLAELQDDGASFPSLSFSSDGRWLATSGGDDVRVFDAVTWRRVATIRGPRIHALSFAPMGPTLLTGSAEGDASLWNIPSGVRAHHLREVGEPVDAVAFSHDGQLAVTASRDGAEQVWKTASGKLQSQGNHLRGKILFVEFDRASKLIVAAGVSGNVSIEDANSGMPITTLDGPTNVVRVAHLDRDSHRVIAASWDGTARVWDATSPYGRWSTPPVRDDCGLITSLVPDGRFIAVGCRSQPTRIWDTARDQLVAELPSVTQVHGDFASAYPAVSATGDRAAIARGNTVEIYELPAGKLTRTIAHRAAVNTVAFADTGHALVSGAVDGSLLVTRDGQAPLALLPFPEGVDAAGFLADGRVTAAAGKRLRVYDPGRNVVLAEFVGPARVRTLRPSADSHRLVTIPSYEYEGGPSVLWDLERYMMIAKLEGPQPYSARFVAQGHDVVTACADGAARLWDGETGQLRRTYRGGSRFLVDVAFSPDGAVLVGGGGDGILRFWDTLTARLLWMMPAHKSILIGVHFQGEDIVTRGFSGELSRWSLPRPDQVIAACGTPERCAIVSR
jgi:WD40 repeat protein/serine/threonine protein kinase